LLDQNSNLSQRSFILQSYLISLDLKELDVLNVSIISGGGWKLQPYVVIQSKLIYDML